MLTKENVLLMDIGIKLIKKQRTFRNQESRKGQLEIRMIYTESLVPFS